jgi:hypothetical protein
LPTGLHCLIFASGVATSKNQASPCARCYFKNCISMTPSLMGPPHPPILCVPPPPLCAPSPIIYPKARGACVARGGLGGHCRPQHDITVCVAKTYNNLHRPCCCTPPFNSYIIPPVLKLQYIDRQGSGVSRKEEGGGGVGATTRQQAMTMTDNTSNNHTEHGTGWGKTAAVMVTMVGLVNARVGQWTLWVGWPQQ